MKRLGLVAAALLAAAPLAASASDTPHEEGALCSNCHLGHNAPGASLTSVLGNYNLCESCHASRSGFGFDAWTVGSQALPGTAGSSHSWSALATNLGATPPSLSSTDPGEVEMAERLDGGKLQCSTCHDQHAADIFPPSGRGTQHVSAVTATPVGAQGSLTVTSVAAEAAAKAYLVDVVVPGALAEAKFRLSNDNGRSWWGCSAPGAYTAYVAEPTNACATAASVLLNDGTNVAVAFGAGTYAIGDRFKLYVSYPFLRADNADARMCLVCHKDRDMRWQDVQGGVANGVSGGVLTSVVLGTTVFSHPVGQALERAYDRVGTSGALLDADGTEQTAGDGNATNDLALSSTRTVTCMTCHHPHNADSNALTVDPR